ncbi:hypothetical protein WA026_021971 [Henosepilachna vigintioctopunctata]|uniref:Uncharacterized protein n=1 Tax=Henosepilachna vigintioctopunctata TaxID=420089 RepID=A0AAW1VDB3_9CUCU
MKDVSKVRLHLITNEDIEQSSTQIPENILPLLGTMKRGFCSCLNPKDYVPLKTVVEQSTPSNCDKNILSYISNLCQKRTTEFYKVVYNSDSDDDDDAPSISSKENPSTTYLMEQPSTSKENEDALIETENIHANKIKKGVCV